MATMATEQSKVTTVRRERRTTSLGRLSGRLASLAALMLIAVPPVPTVATAVSEESPVPKGPNQAGSSYSQPQLGGAAATPYCPRVAMERCRVRWGYGPAACPPQLGVGDEPRPRNEWAE